MARGRARRLVVWGVPIALVCALGVAVVTSLRRDAPNSDGTATTTSIADPNAPSTTPPVPSGDPSAAADAFLAAWQAEDWPSFEASIGSGADVASAAHQAWFTDLDVSSLVLTLDTTTMLANTAVAEYVVEVGVGDAGVWRYRAEVTLVPRGDGWIVDWSPTAVHPSLGTGDHLEVVARWPSRALVADAAGRALVAEEPEVVVGVIPARISSRPELAAALETHLGIAPAALDAIIDAPGVQPDWYLPVARLDRITYVGIRPDLYPVPGVAFRVESNRRPRYGALGEELIGRTGEITAELLEVLGPPYEAGMIVGRSGIERAYETVLAGRPTYDIVRRTTSGDDVVVHGFVGSPGDTLTLGLDIGVQRAAEELVAAAELPTAIVAIDIATGEIRAAASSPEGGFNEALSGLYAPGSTFKIVVATAALETGLARDDVVACPESITVSGKEFRNAASLPASLTLEQAFARSCNTAFIQLGTSLPPEALVDVAERYGFDVDYNIGLAAAGGTFAPTGDAVEYAASMIGQGRVLASPLHMASVASTVAAGRWQVPSIVAGPPADPRGVFDDAVMADMRAMMRAVVAGGTGTSAAISGRDVAGKTGTAEVGEGDEASTVAWFVGFEEELAFAVMVDGGSSGGGAAAPVAREFLLAIEDPATEPADGADCVVAGADWPTFQGAGTRVGCSESAPIAEPRLAWSAEVGAQAWLNSPIVVGSTVVVGSAGTRRAAPDAGDGVYALSLDSGDVRWRFTAANDVNGITAAGDLVVAGGDEGAVWGIALADGSVRWSVETDAPVFGHPAIIGDLAVIGDGSGVLRAIDLGDGSVRWQAQLDGAIRGGPATDGLLLYAVSDLGDVRAFDENGFEIWRDRIVFDTNEGNALAVVYGPPTIIEDRLVVTVSVEGGPGSPGIVAFDRYVGALAWWGSDPDGVSEDRWANVRSSVAYADGRIVLAGSLSGGVQFLAADTGRAVAIGDSGIVCERQWASPVVIGDLVVLPRPDGAVYAFDLGDGSLRWRLPLPSVGTVASTCASSDDVRVADGPELQASIAVAPNGMLIVASTAEGIYAITEGG